MEDHQSASEVLYRGFFLRGLIADGHGLTHILIILGCEVTQPVGIAAEEASSVLECNALAARKMPLLCLYPATAGLGNVDVAV